MSIIGKATLLITDDMVMDIFSLFLGLGDATLFSGTMPNISA